MPMPILRSIALLLVCASLGTTAQVLLKVGLQSHGKIGSLSGLVTAFQKWQVLIGFGLYGVSSLLYITIISRVPVSFAYPFIALTYIGVAVLAWMFLKEPVPPLHVAGLTLIFLGVSLIGIAHRNDQEKSADVAQPAMAATAQR
jgi:drug/metabolite transporter (DMT)-like permease